MNTKTIMQAAVGLSMALVMATSVDAATISGNGANSSSRIRQLMSRIHTVQTTNRVSNSTEVLITSNTGGNSADRNVVGSGGNSGGIEVNTGGIGAGVLVSNQGGSNQVVSDDCGCEAPEVDATIEGNGSRSRNTITISNSTTSMVNLFNRVMNLNSIGAFGNTGENSTDRNVTGDGDIEVTTGDIITEVVVENSGGINEVM